MLGLFKKSTTSVGIDLGSRQIKIAIIDFEKSGPSVRQVFLRSLPLGLIAEGQIIDAEGVSERMRTLLEEMDLSSASIATGVGGQDTFVKFARLQRASKAEALRELPNDRTLRIPIDGQTQFDLQIVDPDGSSPMMRAVVVAARKEAIIKKQNLFYDAGMAPNIIDVDAFGLYNAFAHCHPERGDEPTALVHIGFDTTMLVILRDGHAVLCRQTPIGVHHLQDKIENSGRFGSAGASDVILSDELHNFHGDALEEWLEEISQDIHSSADFVLQEGEKLGSVFLSGGAALIRGMQEGLGRNLDASVSILNPLEHIPLGKDFDKEQAELGPIFAIALGFALRGGR